MVCQSRAKLTHCGWSRCSSTHGLCVPFPPFPPLPLGALLSRCPAPGEVRAWWGLGRVPTLSPSVFPQLHIVHINVKYRTLGEAKGHPSGLAVLGCFFQVGWWRLMGLVPASTRGFEQSTPAV